MKFKYHIYKTGNMFHFIACLADWHFSLRKSFYDKWLDETGELIQEEKEALRVFRKILSKYPFGPTFLGKVLIGYSDRIAWEKLEKWVTKEEYAQIKNIFKTFDSRFDKIWEKSRPDLLKKKQKLRTKKFKIDSIIKDLENFYGRKNNIKKINVFVIGISKGNGGQATLGKGRVWINFSGDIPEFHIFSGMMHEIHHMIFGFEQKREVKKYLEKNKFETKILKLGYNGDAQTFMTEGLTYSLHTNGYFDEKYLGLKILELKTIIEKAKRDNNIYWATQYIASKMKKTAKDYIENKRVIDQKYLAKIHQAYLDYLKEVK